MQLEMLQDEDDTDDVPGFIGMRLESHCCLLHLMVIVGGHSVNTINSVAFPQELVESGGHRDRSGQASGKTYVISR